MELLTELMKLNEGKIVDRRILGSLEKIFKKIDPKAKIITAEENKRNRFHSFFEGEVEMDKSKALNRASANKLEDALEKFAFDELISSGQTVMGAEIDAGDKENLVFFTIELDQD